MSGPGAPFDPGGRTVVPQERVATGDLVVDAAVTDLAALDGADLDGHIEAAEALHRTLQARLADLGE